MNNDLYEGIYTVICKVEESGSNINVQQQGNGLRNCDTLSLYKVAQLP